MAPVSEASALQTSPKLRDHIPPLLRVKPSWDALVRRAPAPAPPDPNYHPGQGASAPETFNNKGYFALFALLGAAMVIAAIWFFFWAPNGGFKWRKNDWDDYKSTVLRRKGKDGKTLSNATPRTDLGQKSVAGTFDNDRREMAEVESSLGGYSDHPRDSPTRQRPREHGHRQQQKPRTHRRHEPLDDAVRAYREERPARVGGMNRQHEGSHFDFTNSDRSERFSDVVSNNSRTHLQPKQASTPEPQPKKKGFLERRAAKRDQKRIDKAAKKTQDTKARSPGQVKQRLDQRRGYDDDSTVADAAEHYARQTSESHYANMYRPQAQAGTGAGRPAANTPRRTEDRRRSQQPSSEGRAGGAGFRRQQQQQPLPKAPGSFDTYSEAGSSETGTRVYSHHIPALSRGSRDTGFRRGGAGGRRDSLSDSD